MMVTDLPSFDRVLADRMRADAHEMVEAYVRTVLDHAPSDSVTGVYAKGSAYKSWDSIIDYVPEVSDVDIHVRFVDDLQATRFLQSLGLALQIAERALERFHAKVSDPTHVPRPQLLVLNEVEKLPGYLASPTAIVRTLYGSPFEGGSREDYADARPADGQRFVADAHYVQRELPHQVIDRPGHHAWRAISLLGWRVAPAGPRLLTQLGMHPYEAWTLNRSGVVSELIARGQSSLAQAYADFYLAGWDGVNTNFREGTAARRALDAVARLYTEGLELIQGRSCSTDQSQNG